MFRRFSFPWDRVILFYGPPRVVLGKNTFIAWLFPCTGRELCSSFDRVSSAIFSSAIFCDVLPLFWLFEPKVDWHHSLAVLCTIMFRIRRIHADGFRLVGLWFILIMMWRLILIEYFWFYSDFHVVGRRRLSSRVFSRILRSISFRKKKGNAALVFKHEDDDNRVEILLYDQCSNTHKPITIYLTTYLETTTKIEIKESPMERRNKTTTDNQREIS